MFGVWNLFEAFILVIVFYEFCLASYGQILFANTKRLAILSKKRTARRLPTLVTAYRPLTDSTQITHRTLRRRLGSTMQAPAREIHMPHPTRYSMHTTQTHTLEPHPRTMSQSDRARRLARTPAASSTPSEPVTTSCRPPSSWQTPSRAPVSFGPRGARAPRSGRARPLRSPPRPAPRAAPAPMTRCR